jgi:hypothetical protein
MHVKEDLSTTETDSLSPSTQILSSIDSSEKKTQTQLKDIIAGNEDVRIDTLFSRTQLGSITSQLSQIQEDMNSLRLGQQDLGDNIGNLGQMLDMNILQVSNTSSNSSESLEDITKVHLKLTQALLSQLTGHSTTWTADVQSIASNMTTLDKIEVERNISKQLISCPSTLHDACELLNLPLHNRRFAREGSCSFQLEHIRVFSSSDCGPIRFTARHNAEHERTCMLYHSGRRSKSYSMKLQFVPFIQQTIEFTLNSKNGAGGSSLSPSIKFYYTVGRSMSPIFSMFDDVFAKASSQKLYSYKGAVAGSWLDNQNRFFRFDWNIPEARIQLRKFVEELTELFGQGLADASHKDEYGNTMLHVCRSSSTHRPMLIMG